MIKEVINKYMKLKLDYVSSTNEIYEELKEQYERLLAEFNSLSDEEHFKRIQNMSKYIKSLDKFEGIVELDGILYSIESIENLLKIYFFEFMLRYNKDSEVIQLIAVYVNPCYIYAFKNIKLNAIALAMDKVMNKV